MVAVQLLYAMNEYFGQVQGCVGLWHSRAASFSARGRLRLVLSQVATGHRDRHRSQGPGARVETRGRWLLAGVDAMGYGTLSETTHLVAAVVLSAVWSVRAARQTDEPQRELQQLRGQYEQISWMGH